MTESKDHVIRRLRARTIELRELNDNLRRLVYAQRDRIAKLTAAAKSGPVQCPGCQGWVRADAPEAVAACVRKSAP